MLSLEEVFALITAEREYQDAKWGSIEENQQSLAGFLLIIRKELEEAEAGWMKNVPGKHSALSELIQVAATSIAALQQYGSEGNFK
jgi:hypothetical protein